MQVDLRQPLFRARRSICRTHLVIELAEHLAHVAHHLCELAIQRIGFVALSGLGSRSSSPSHLGDLAQRYAHLAKAGDGMAILGQHRRCPHELLASLIIGQNIVGVFAKFLVENQLVDFSRFRQEPRLVPVNLRQIEDAREITVAGVAEVDPSFLIFIPLFIEDMADRGGSLDNRRYHFRANHIALTARSDQLGLQRLDVGTFAGTNQQVAQQHIFSSRSADDLDAVGRQDVVHPIGAALATKVNIFREGTGHSPVPTAILLREQVDQLAKAARTSAGTDHVQFARHGHKGSAAHIVQFFERALGVVRPVGSFLLFLCQSITDRCHLSLDEALLGLCHNRGLIVISDTAHAA